MSQPRRGRGRPAPPHRGLRKSPPGGSPASLPHGSARGSPAPGCTPAPLLKGSRRETSPCRRAPPRACQGRAAPRGVGPRTPTSGQRRGSRHPQRLGHRPGAVAERAPPQEAAQRREAGRTPHRRARGQPWLPHLPLPAAARCPAPKMAAAAPPSLRAPPITAEPPPRMPRPRPAAAAHAPPRGGGARRLEAPLGGGGKDGPARSPPGAVVLRRGARWELWSVVGRRPGRRAHARGGRQRRGSGRGASPSSPVRVGTACGAQGYARAGRLLFPPQRPEAAVPFHGAAGSRCPSTAQGAGPTHRHPRGSPAPPPRTAAEGGCTKCPLPDLPPTLPPARPLETGDPGSTERRGQAPHGRAAAAGGRAQRRFRPQQPSAPREESAGKQAQAGGALVPLGSRCRAKGRRTEKEAGKKTQHKAGVQ